MRKSLIYNDDGWSSYMRRPAPMTPEQIVDVTVGTVIGTAVKVYQFCALGGHAVNYNSSFLPRIGENLEAIRGMHVWRMRETLRSLDSLGTDPLHIVARACRENDIACQFSLRMNDRHHTYTRGGEWYFPELQSAWLDEHPELLLPDRALDYTQPGVSEYRERQIREVLDTYDVAGIDLDFTRFKPWFPAGKEQQGAPILTRLLRDLSEMVRRAGKTFSARFEYDPRACQASGLDVETILAEGLLDQITLGGVGDHTPDAPCDWWVERAHRTGAKVYPGVEGQLHWIAACGAGGAGLHPGGGVADGYGPPRMEYLRAVAGNHYASGADGLSFFNFTCADGPFPKRIFTELADPAAVKRGNKQYVAAVWPWDCATFEQSWTSRARIEPGQTDASIPLRLCDTFVPPALPSATLTLDLMGINRIDDVDIRFNGKPVVWTGYDYNHYEHGCWNDILTFGVPSMALHTGENVIELHRTKRHEGFTGSLEVRKCILDLTYPNRSEEDENEPRFTPGSIA
ncbi:MAG: hypothetical protein JXA11_13320 [Phycisphaerae bacterium]|nr:hypothetical protein [Phycisphaerae bacterium]